MKREHVGARRLLREDLAAVRSYELPYDADRGRARLLAAISLMGPVVPTTAGLAGVVEGASAPAAKAVGAAQAGWAKVLIVTAVSGLAVSSADTAPPGDEPPHAPVCVAPDASEGPPAEPSATASGALSSLPIEPVRDPVDVKPNLSRSRPPPAGTPSPVRGPVARGDTFSSEVRALGAARELLVEDPAEALRRVDEAQPGHALREEREILAIRALVAMDCREEARERARRLLAVHPSSPFAAVARKLVASLPPAAASAEGGARSCTR